MVSLSRFFRRGATALALSALGLTAAPARAQAPALTGVLREITEVVGLQPRFELRATNQIPNAAAVVYGGKRYLLYNPKFVAAVNRSGHTDWAGISILAHEMGHHLNGHTLRPGGSQPQDELEADEFSGFVLRKMGASLAQAQAALAAVADDEGSATHPGRLPRLASIGKGWGRAQTQIAASAGPLAPLGEPAAVAPALAAEGTDDDENGFDASPAADAAAVVAAALDAQTAAPLRLLGRLTFRNKPQERYYLTSALEVVHLSVGADARTRNAEVVGRLRRTQNATFPFVLEDNTQRHLFVTPRGDVYDKEGQRVAKLHEPS